MSTPTPPSQTRPSYSNHFLPWWRDCVTLSIPLQEFQLAISAAKRGKMSDARLAGYVLKADDMLRLRHLRVRDVFEMLVSTVVIETAFGFRGPSLNDRNTDRCGRINHPLVIGARSTSCGMLRACLTQHFASSSGPIRRYFHESSLHRSHPPNNTIRRRPPGILETNQPVEI